MAADRTTTLRTIQFFRADIGTDADGRLRPFDARAVLSVLAALPADERYVHDAEGDSYACWPEPDGRRPSLVFGKVRRSNFPQVERLGAVSGLNLPPDSGLLEAIHVVFFPDNIVGAEFNFYGPRLGRLSNYIREHSGGLLVHFGPLLRRDVLERIDRLDDIRMFNLRIDREFAEAVRTEAPDLGAAMATQMQFAGAAEVEVVLRMKPHSRQHLGNQLKGFVRRLAVKDGVAQGASRFKVSGYDPEANQVEEVDVLKDLFVAHKRIVKANESTRAVERESAFRAVSEAYEENYEELLAAAAAR